MIIGETITTVYITSKVKIDTPNEEMVGDFINRANSIGFMYNRIIRSDKIDNEFMEVTWSISTVESFEKRIIEEEGIERAIHEVSEILKEDEISSAESSFELFVD